MTPHTQKSIGIMSGDCRENSMDPHLPIHLSGKVSSRKFWTAVAKWGGAPSCWKFKLLKSGCCFNAGVVLLVRERECVCVFTLCVFHVSFSQQERRAQQLA